MFEPITITQDNLEWAVRENIARAYRQAQRLMLAQNTNILGNTNAAGFSVDRVDDPVEPSDAVTRGWLLDQITNFYQGNQ